MGRPRKWNDQERALLDKCNATVRRVIVHILENDYNIEELKMLRIIHSNHASRETNLTKKLNHKGIIKNISKIISWKLEDRIQDQKEYSENAFANEDAIF